MTVGIFQSLLASTKLSNVQPTKPFTLNSVCFIIPPYAVLRIVDICIFCYVKIILCPVRKEADIDDDSLTFCPELTHQIFGER